MDSDHNIGFSVRGLLGNAHVQSLLTSGPWRKIRVRRTGRHYRARAEQVILDAGEGVRLMGHAHQAEQDRQDALVILLHGWEGSADSNYLLSCGAHLDRCGFDTFRLNFRDHGPTHHLNEDLFHSCRLREVLEAVRVVAAGYHRGPVFLVGFSLGGNFALRIARNAGSVGLNLQRTIAVCPVVRPAHVLHALENGLSLYHTYFIRKWRRSLAIKQKLFPELYDLKEWFRLDSLRDQTDYLVEHYTEFPNLDAYLEAYSIDGSYLDGLDASSLIIAATDDPIIPAADFRTLPSPNTLDLVLTPSGGHCGYLENWRMSSWIDRQIENELCRNLNRN